MTARRWFVLHLSCILVLLLLFIGLFSTISVGYRALSIGPEITSESSGVGGGVPGMGSRGGTMLWKFTVTEVDEPIGFGPNQAPRQAGPNTGAAEGSTVQMVTQMPYADAATVVHLTITPLP